VLRLADLAERGKGLAVNLYDENLKQMQPSDTATLIYTSGTTGTPKGSIITHRNILAEVEGLQGVFQFGPEKIGMMCLPLAHVIARAMQFYQLAQGCQGAYVQNLDMLPANLREIAPHFMAGVPRLFEKMHDKILGQVHQASGPVQKLFQWSLKVGSEMSMHIQRRLKISPALKLKWGVAHLLIFRKIRKGLGGNIDCFISGGAPLRKEIAQFFHSIGILVVEGYGLTETFAAVALNRLDDFRFGSVGKPLDGVRVKIAKDGEICVKGDIIFSGYWHLKKETEESFDTEGWFLTGDIGEFTKDGFLRITDRKRDIIKTSGGKMVAPQSIESLMQQSRYIQQFMVYGEGKKFLSALVTLNWEAVENYAKTNGIVLQDRENLSQDPKIIDLIQEEINQKNRNLSNFETIKKFVILPGDFTVETGELTPTMKLKRNLVFEKYRSQLDQLYNGV
ncbi:MAG: long-chain fatty acid--CoA ligase, partial [bacterium]|nr:long-chain fatty acid--CoA ligase [bacterium]